MNLQIAHLCNICDKKLYYTKGVGFKRNYVYHEGLYYCKDCFMVKKRGIKK